MPTAVATRCLLACLLAYLCCPPAAARSARMQVERLDAAVAVLEDVEVRLEWPGATDQGELRVRAGEASAPDLGYRFHELDWRCPLRREGAGWRCEGPLRARGRGEARLAVHLDVAGTRASLERGPARISLERDAAAPDLTRIDLRQVPIRWAEALVALAWDEARLGDGRLGGQVMVDAGAADGVGIEAALAIDDASLDTPDGRIAAAGVGARLQVDARLGAAPGVRLDGTLRGGEMLFGNAYVTLADRDVAMALDAARGPDGGWAFDDLAWRDGDRLVALGRARMASDGSLDALDMRVESAALGRLGESYLGGWLGLAGLSDLRLSGRLRGRVLMDATGLQEADVALAGAGLDDPRGRFAFRGLEGSVAFSASRAVDSQLQWQEGTLHGIDFGPGRLPLRSGDGTLVGREDVVLDVLGGQVRFEDLRIRPPGGDAGLDVRFGLGLESLDIARISDALGWPAFNGTLSGRIPRAHYADDRLDLDGGLGMQLFEGEVTVSSLSMERPFGVLPTLSADIALDGLDLQSLTGVFGFGSISGRLHGRVDRLRLLDWAPVAFDAELRTERAAGVRQRISQRAVQDLSSVGDASFMGSLQGRLIGVFDDFGYSRIGIGCTLVDEVCDMHGLRAAGRGFTIVEGSGIPRLTVVGYNRRVHWPTLVERLAAVGSGEVAPVVD